MSVGGEGLSVPSSDGTDYRRVIMVEANEPQRVIPSGISTGSIAVRAWNSDGVIFLGWDDAVTIESGFPLEDGDSFTVSLDANEQALWAVGDTAGDQIRVISIN